MSIVARRWLVAIVLLAASVGSAGTAHAYVYFAGQERIGRATNDGATVEPEFIKVSGFTCGVAVDAHHIYWATIGSSPEPSSIGRANLNGTEVEPAFISLPGTDPCGIALTATHVYWADMAGYVGKAEINGGNMSTHWAEAAEACGIAANEEFIYVAHGGGGGFGLNELAASGVSEGQVVATIETSGSCGVALDPPYVYWASGGQTSSGETIGRAEASFLLAHNDSWLTTTANPITRPWSVAAHQGELYYAPYAGPIGRFKLDGSQPLEPSFINSGGDVVGIAVDDLPLPTPPSPAPAPNPGSGPSGSNSSNGLLKLLKTKVRSADGTATLVLRVRGTGLLVLSGKDVKTDRVAVKKPGKVTLALEPGGAALRDLAHAGRVRVSFTITFTPKAGALTKTKDSVTLVER